MTEPWFPIASRRLLLAFMLALLCVLGACATTSTPEGEHGQVQEMGLNPADPWEKYNRAIFSFNDWFDRNLFVPVAKGYIAITPEVVRTGVGNFFSNLGEPFSMVNNLLQGDIEGSGTSFMRFLTNTVFGFFGVMDVATEIGMRKNEEDFGQTLGAWGVEQGNYLMLPFLGPSTTRDVFSYADWLYYDTYWPAETNEQRYAAIALKLINQRAELLDLEDQIIGDRYSFIRDVYLQRREFLVQDGKVEQDAFSAEDDFGDDDFDNLEDEF